MRTLIFDTETNGKRPKNNTDLKREPALVQLAAILFEERRPVAHTSFFVRPLAGDGSPALIPTEQFFIDAGITQARVDAVGVPLKVALAAFNNMARNADRVVAHNIEFDDPIVRAAYQRVEAASTVYDTLPKYCTMHTLTDILKIPGKYGPKYPSLAEAYTRLVDPAGFLGAHDAMVDVQACASILWACEDKQYKLWSL